MKRLFTLLAAMMVMVTISAKSVRETVVFAVDLHCQGCVDKVEKNIAFERGVKDLRCDLKSKTVAVTYDPAKTNIATLQEAFARIKKPATVYHQPAGEIDAQTEATKPQK